MTLKVYCTFCCSYLCLALLESVRKSFGGATTWHVLLFPHLLYPAYQAALTGSVFMTVAVAAERFSAVHFPLSYSQVICFKNSKLLLLY